jgi:hypothetical protein
VSLDPLGDALGSANLATFSMVSITLPAALTLALAGSVFLAITVAKTVSADDPNAARRVTPPTRRPPRWSPLHGRFIGVG